MKITYETSIRNFKAWSGAVDTLDRIISEGLEDDFEMLLEEINPDGWDETELNDFLWFDDEYIFELLGISDEE